MGRLPRWCPLFQQTEKLVERHWRSIECVADALVGRRELSGAEFEAVIGRVR
jgi:hypothetical protein